MDNSYNVLNGNNQNEENTIAVVSMVLGILSVVLCFVPIVGLALGIVALILAIKGIKKSRDVNKGKGFSIAGLSCGCTGICLNLIYCFVWLMMGMIFKMTFDELNELDYNSINYNRYNSSYNRTYDYNYNRNYNKYLDDYDF